MGPPAGRVAAHTTPAAPSRTGRPPGTPRSVATQPGHTALAVSSNEPAPLETLTMRPPSAIRGSRATVVRQAR